MQGCGDRVRRTSRLPAAGMPMVARQRGAFPDAGRSLRGVRHSHHSRVTGEIGKPVSVTTMAGRAARSLSPRQAGDRPARGAPGPARRRGASPQQSGRTLPRQRPVLRTVSRGVARCQAGLATPGRIPVRNPQRLSLQELGPTECETGSGGAGIAGRKQGSGERRDPDNWPEIPAASGVARCPPVSRILSRISGTLSETKGYVQISKSRHFRYNKGAI